MTNDLSSLGQERLEPDSFDALESVSPPSAIDASTNALEDRIQTLEQQVREERFLFFIALLTLFDAWTFTHFTTLSSPLVIFALEVIALVVLARRYQIPEMQMLIGKVIEYRTGKPLDEPIVASSSTQKPDTPAPHL